MYRVEKTFLKYLKPETMRIEKGSAGGYVIIDDAHHHYGWTPTVEEASAKLIELYSEHVTLITTRISRQKRSWPHESLRP